MKALSSTEADGIAVSAFQYLGEDRDRLDRFLAISGLTLANLRSAAQSDGFLGGILDYFASDQGLTASFAAHLGLPAERIDQARLALSGRKAPDDT